MKPSLWILRNFRNTARFHGRQKAQMKRACPGCPYRKDQPNWMDFDRTFYNVACVENGVQQNCHMAMKSGKIMGCYGSLVCISGGNEQIVSPQELRDRPMCASEDCHKVYQGNFPWREANSAVKKPQNNEPNKPNGSLEKSLVESPPPTAALSPTKKATFLSRIFFWNRRKRNTIPIE